MTVYHHIIQIVVHAFFEQCNCVLESPLACLAHLHKLNAGNVAEEEVMYTLFNLAQFLGFVEVVRREGPREDAFLQAGNPQGSDTLATLVEGLRFVMSAASGNLVVSNHCYHHSLKAHVTCDQTRYVQSQASIVQQQDNSAYYQQPPTCL